MTHTLVIAVPPDGPFAAYHGTDLNDAMGPLNWPEDSHMIETESGTIYIREPNAHFNPRASALAEKWMGFTYVRLTGLVAFVAEDPVAAIEFVARYSDA